MISKAGHDWLKNSKNPSIRYRYIKDYLQEPPGSSIKKEISESRIVKKIFSKMEPEGYWLFRGTGDSIDYAMSSSTHFILSYLAELGLDKSDPRIDMAVNRYLNLSQPGGKWLDPPDHKTGQSCLYAHNLRTFLLMGYRDDPRIQERIETLKQDIRFDNGYLCIRKNFKSTTKSCIRGSLKALMAYSELPETWNSDSCQRLIHYFIDRNVYFKSDDPDTKIRGGMGVIFPYAINCSLLEALYALCKMGYGNHKALDNAWQTLKNHDNGEGKIILDWYPPSPFIPGKKGEINEWATLYAYMAVKYKNENTIAR